MRRRSTIANRRAFLAGTGTLATGGLVAAATGAREARDDESSPPSGGFGFVDLGRALVMLERGQRHADAIRGIDEWLGKQRDAVQLDMDGLRRREAALESYEPGSEGYRAEEDELAVAALRLERKRQRLEQEFDQKRANAVRSLYHRAKAVCELVRQERGLLAVLPYSSRLGGSNPEQVAAEVALQPVITFAEGLDLTDEVLQRLQQLDQLEKQGKPSGENEQQPPP